MVNPVTAYSFLPSLYAYTNNIILGTLVGAGLLYLKFGISKHGVEAIPWREQVNYMPLPSPLHVLLYFAAMAFLMIVTFAPPSLDSPYAKAIQGYAWWILPTVGLSSLLLGVAWWLGLQTIQLQKRRKLVVNRTPVLDMGSRGDYIQIAELVERMWHIRVKSDLQSEDGDDVFEMSAPVAAAN